jgi:hypothetical protein
MYSACITMPPVNVLCNTKVATPALGCAQLAVHVA